MSESPIRVSISDSFQVDGIAIYIGLSYGQGDIRAMHISDDGGLSPVMERVDPAVISNPTIRLSSDFALALRDALNRYYGDTYDDRALRADYKEERRRTDKLTDAIIELARNAYPPQLSRIPD